MSNSLRPHGLYNAWNSPGQNTFPSPGDLPNPGIEPRSPTLQADSLPAEPPGKPLKGKLIQLYPTLCDPKDCSLPGSSVHGIFQVRILEWVAMASQKVPPRTTSSSNSQICCKLSIPAFLSLGSPKRIRQ